MPEERENRLLVNLQMAARLLSVCPRTVWGLAANGELPSIKIGRRRLFSVAELRRWVAERTAEGRGATADAGLEADR